MEKRNFKLETAIDIVWGGLELKEMPLKIPVLRLF